MTQPIGTPDWQRTQPGASKVLYATTDMASSGITVGPFFCGSFAAIAMYLKLTGIRYFVHPHFYTDALTTIDASGLEYVGEDGATMLVNVPVHSPWVSFSFGATGGVVVEHGPVVLIGNNSGTDASVMRNPQPIIGVVNQAIGASASAALIAAKTLDGPGIWTVTSTVATWSATLSGINVSGNPEVIARMSSGSGPPSLNVPLPNGCARVDFTNGTAAAGTFSTSLYAGRS